MKLKITKEQAEDIQNISGFDSAIEDQIISSLTESLTKEIDRNIIEEIFGMSLLDIEAMRKRNEKIDKLIGE